MGQPTPNAMHTVLPADFSSGSTNIMLKYTSEIEAKREAIRQTAITGKQHVVLTATYYSEVIAAWDSSVVEQVVLPYSGPILP